LMIKAFFIAWRNLGLIALKTTQFRPINSYTKKARCCGYLHNTGLSFNGNAAPTFSRDGLK